jgi:hypothetical protein
MRKSRRKDTQLFSMEILPFQCTFCTETFKTKHDWQRHEKTLHLPLERWVCSLHGPRMAKPASSLGGQDGICCVFCGDTTPDDAHLEEHGYAACQERDLDERTFHRKDHLVQHLRLIHGVKFMDSTMKEWKVQMPEIRSICGFCGVQLASWTERTEHLAEHFKMGKVMADWQGDWGFDGEIVKLVENAILPCKISKAIYGAVLQTKPRCRSEQLRTKHPFSHEGRGLLTHTIGFASQCL